VYLGAGIDHLPGLRFAINIDPAQFEVFAAAKTGRGRNELLQLGPDVAKRPQVAVMAGMAVVIYHQPSGSWAFTIRDLGNVSSSSSPVPLPPTNLSDVTAASVVHPVSSAPVLALFDSNGGCALFETRPVNTAVAAMGLGLKLVAQFLLVPSMKTKLSTATAAVVASSHTASSWLLLQAVTTPESMYGVQGCALAVQLWRIPTVPSLALVPQAVGDVVCVANSTPQLTSLSVAPVLTTSANVTAVEALVSYSAGGQVFAAYVELQLQQQDMVHATVNGQEQGSVVDAIAVDVGEAVSSSAAVLTTDATTIDSSLVVMVHGKGFCWNNEKRNKDAATGSCDQTPSIENDSSVLSYTYGSITDWKTHLCRASASMPGVVYRETTNLVMPTAGPNGALLSPCNAHLVHGSYDQGHHPAAGLYARDGSGGSGDGRRGTAAAAFAIVEVHEGFDASAGDTDGNKCGAPLSKPGIVMDAWAL
jgi:hypothetical protein